MSGYQYYESMNFNSSPYGYADQPTYPPLLYAHDPSIHIKDEPESDGTLLLDYSHASGQSSQYSTSSPEMASNFQEEEKPLPSQYETERFLREYLKIPEPMPLDLYALRDHFNPTDKPKPAIAALIALSIWGCPQKRLSLKEIYEAIEARYPSWSSFNPPDGKIPPWKGSIRHNLSLKAMFRHENREGSTNQKSGFWHLNVAYGYGDKRVRVRSRSQGSTRDADEYDYDCESSSPPHWTGNQGYPVTESSVIHESISGHRENRPHPSRSNDLYAPPYAAQTSNTHEYQLLGGSSYPGNGQHQQVPTHAPTSYVFVHEGMHQNPLPQSSNSTDRPSNIVYSSYSDYKQTNHMAGFSQGSSSSRRHISLPGAMESQMPQRAPRTRRTN